MEQERLGAAIDFSAAAHKGKGMLAMCTACLQNKRMILARCPPRIGNEVGSGAFHLEGVFLATAFNRRKPDVLRYSHHAEKSCTHMDTHRHAHFLYDTQQVITAESLTRKHLSLYRQG